MPLSSYASFAQKPLVDPALCLQVTQHGEFHLEILRQGILPCLGGHPKPAGDQRPSPLPWSPRFLCSCKLTGSTADSCKCLSQDWTVDSGREEIALSVLTSPTPRPAPAQSGSSPRPAEMNAAAPCSGLQSLSQLSTSSLPNLILTVISLRKP